jgi:hypothetical protein
MVRNEAGEIVYQFPLQLRAAAMSARGFNGSASNDLPLSCASSPRTSAFSARSIIRSENVGKHRLADLRRAPDGDVAARVCGRERAQNFIEEGKARAGYRGRERRSRLRRNDVALRPVEVIDDRGGVTASAIARLAMRSILGSIMYASLRRRRARAWRRLRSPNPRIRLLGCCAIARAPSAARRAAAA